MKIKDEIAHMIRSLSMILEEEKKIPIPNPINAPELLKNKVAFILCASPCFV